MFEVVPVSEVSSPGAGLIQIGKPAHGEFRAVLGGFEQGLHEGVVVGDPRPGVRRFDPEPVEHGKHGGGLERAAVVAVQHRLGGHRMYPLGQRGALHEMARAVGVVVGMDLPAYDLTAVQIHDQVQVEPGPVTCAGK